MSLHSPFGYVGYEVKMAKTMVDLMERFCGGCHTDKDYKNGCHGCPIGRLIDNCRTYMKIVHPADEHFLEETTQEYADRFLKGKTEEQIKERQQHSFELYKLSKPEGDLIRRLKRQAHLRQYPGMLSQWVWEPYKKPDKLLRLKKTIEDLEFVQSHRFRNFAVRNDYDQQIKNRIKDELWPLHHLSLQEADKQKVLRRLKGERP